MQYKLFDKLVFSKIKTKLGGRVRFFGSGGAAAPLPVVQFFEDIGIPVLEGYGLTETCEYIIIWCGGSMLWYDIYWWSMQLVYGILYYDALSSYSACNHNKYDSVE